MCPLQLPPSLEPPPDDEPLLGPVELSEPLSSPEVGPLVAPVPESSPLDVLPPELALLGLPLAGPLPFKPDVDPDKPELEAPLDVPVRGLGAADGFGLEQAVIAAEETMRQCVAQNLILMPLLRPPIGRLPYDLDHRKHAIEILSSCRASIPRRFICILCAAPAFRPEATMAA